MGNIGFSHSAQVVHSLPLSLRRLRVAKSWAARTSERRSGGGEIRDERGEAG